MSQDRLLQSLRRAYWGGDKDVLPQLLHELGRSGQLWASTIGTDNFRVKVRVHDAADYPKGPKARFFWTAHSYLDLKNMTPKGKIRKVLEALRRDYGTRSRVLEAREEWEELPDSAYEDWAAEQRRRFHQVYPQSASAGWGANISRPDFWIAWLRDRMQGKIPTSTDVECPVCSAGPQESCRSLRGGYQPLMSPHRERVGAARGQRPIGWNPGPDERLRELERRWQESGSEEDELVYRRQKHRVDDQPFWPFVCNEGVCQYLESVATDSGLLDFYYHPTADGGEVVGAYGPEVADFDYWPITRLRAPRPGRSQKVKAPRDAARRAGLL